MQFLLNYIHKAFLNRRFKKAVLQVTEAVFQKSDA
jgi:hypothetical protein